MTATLDQIDRGLRNPFRQQSRIGRHHELVFTTMNDQGGRLDCAKGIPGVMVFAGLVMEPLGIDGDGVLFARFPHLQHLWVR